MTSVPLATLEEKWTAIETAINNTTAEHLITTHKKTKNEWMTQEILDLMKERRLHTNRNNIEYRHINKISKNKIKFAKKNGCHNTAKKLRF